MWMHFDTWPSCVLGDGKAPFSSILDRWMLDLLGLSSVPLMILASVRGGGSDGLFGVFYVLGTGVSLWRRGGRSLQSGPQVLVVSRSLGIRTQVAILQPSFYWVTYYFCTHTRLCLWARGHFFFVAPFGLWLGCEEEIGND